MTKSENKDLVALKEKELERLLYVFSHDFRSPVATIKGYVGLMRDYLEQGDRDGLAHSLGAIEDGVAKLQDLMAASLQVSRMNTGDLSLTTFSFGALADAVLEDFSDRTNITLLGRDFEITADWSMMCTAALAMLENARMHGAKDGVLDATLACETGAGGTVISVTDKGEGFDPAQKERLFLLFEKGNGANRGHGAGLALVAKVAERHGGSADMTLGEHGVGAKVWIQLPTSSAGSSGT